jgi:uncharacterized protein YPO0396
MNTLAIPPLESFVLTHLDIYDWGAFGGRHSVPMDVAGTAIIGPTGSGKTTLVDALMTLLVATPRYNLASTGGHDSDRDLVSYVRGVSGAGTDDDTTDHISRPGPVVTAIAARFSDGDAVVSIGGVFWFEGSSSALADLRRRWVFCLGDVPSLDDWLEAHRENGARALKELERIHPGFKLYESKNTFLARLRNHFEVTENAFALLNRAAGLKQIDSIDKVFRELVLDDRSAFETAKSVVDEFGTLAGIRQELETARRQRETLVPIDKSWGQHVDISVKLEERKRLLGLLPIWFAERVMALWHAQRKHAEAELLKRQSESDELKGQVAAAEAAEEACHATYLLEGGQDIENLSKLITLQRVARDQRQRDASAYQTMARALGLPSGLTAADVEANRASVEPRRVEEQQRHEEQKRTAWEMGAKQASLLADRERIDQELAAAKRRPKSNIPDAQYTFRDALAQHLGLDAEALPFVAELIEVQAAQHTWRGAIERAIGSERLRILIAPEHLDEALAWVNGRDTGLHVRLREANEPAGQARFFDDGFTRKLNFRPHAHREALKHLLADIDRHCVSDVAALHRTPHAMTAEGLMSGRAGFFEKQDQRPLRADWMTGFDNRDRVAQLMQDLAKVIDLHQASQDALKTAEGLAEATERGLVLLQRLEDVTFESIDVVSAENDLAQLEDQMAALTNPESDAQVAEQRWRAAQSATRTVRQAQIDVGMVIGKISDAIERAHNAIQQNRLHVGAGLLDDERNWVDQHIDPPSFTDPTLLADVERTTRERIESERDSFANRLKGIEQQLIRDMGRAKSVDTGALTEAAVELQDVPAYRERLRVLDEEALPEKIHRFQQYLNQSSDQGVTQLLSDIANEVAGIEERIADLNTTLKRVDFQPGRYLHLEPQRVDHERLHALRLAQAHLRSAQLKDDGGESHYQALTRVVELLQEAADRRKLQGSLALLDPRYRLQFAVWVIARDDGRIIEKRTSSQGGSGGEKEIIASYVLTASLSYALCPPNRQRPLFGTVVLDEAFSKSSHAVAGRIIRALAEFGLHPLFVTPNKELRLLRDHTRSAIVVHRRGTQATVTSLTWEELEHHARERHKRTEVAVEIAE